MRFIQNNNNIIKIVCGALGVWDILHGLHKGILHKSLNLIKKLTSFGYLYEKIG